MEVEFEFQKICQYYIYFGLNASHFVMKKSFDKNE